MASTFLKDNFKSMKGSISKKEEEWLKKSLPNVVKEQSNFTGSVSEKELGFFKKLLEEE